MKSFESEKIFLEGEEGVEQSVKALSGGRQAFLFTDERVLSLYGNFSLPYFAMACGEENKSLFTLESLLKRMAEEGLSRSSLLICMGGGVVTDLGGLAASLYMRGISHVLFPTTLLSQADACIGGKTAVNFSGVKNLLGSFYFPERIYFSPRFLDTLSKRELVCGLGEIIKCGALSSELITYLLQNKDELFCKEVLWQCVKKCVALKEEVVKRDPFDASLRACLNLGHTTAHALEMGNLGLNHGECVLYGLILESGFARRLGGNEGFLKAMKELCLRAYPDMPPLALSKEALSLSRKDKKNKEGGKISLVIAKDVGDWREIVLPFEEYFEGVCKEMEKVFGGGEV